MKQNMAIDAGKLHGAHKIDLRAVMIGNGWYDPLLNYAGYYNYTTQNTYDVRFKHDWQREQQYLAMFGEGNCELMLFSESPRVEVVADAVQVPITPWTVSAFRRQAHGAICLIRRGDADRSLQAITPSATMSVR